MSENDIVVTKESAIEALKAAVTEKGSDYVYVNGAGESPTSLEDSVRCSYVHWSASSGVPGCIVGSTLHRLGVPLRDFSEAEYHSAEDLEKYIPNLVFEDGVGEILQAAQTKQDAGKTWGTAYRAALNEAGWLHGDSPHTPGTLHDCVVCENNCFCGNLEAGTKCLFCNLQDGNFGEAMACGE